MTRKQVIETLKGQALKHEKIATVTNGLLQQDHLKIAECFKQAALLLSK